MGLSLYNFFWRLIRPFIGLLLWHRARRGKEIAGRWPERYGRASLPAEKLHCKTASYIWLHAVSVGESVAAMRLATALASRFPDCRFLITTNTVTGYNSVTKAMADHPALPIGCVMQPLDHPDFVDAFLTTWRPRAAIFMESDFWPNLICRSKQRGIPVIFASSQLSGKAIAGWQKRPRLAQDVFGAADLILPVDDQQATQFRTLIGAVKTPPLIKVMGSLKLPDKLHPDKNLQKTLKDAAAGRRIFLAASTHIGEDEIIIDAAKNLGAGWLTIIAPRHPHRGDAVARLADDAPQRQHGHLPDQTTQIYIMDSLGEMGTLFSLADYVFLGGSLIPAGGHNPLEPAGFGLPILTGQHIFKNKAEFEGLVATGAVFQVADAKQIKEQITKLENDQLRRKRLAKATKAYVATANHRAQMAASAIQDLLDSPFVNALKTDTVITAHHDKNT